MKTRFEELQKELTCQYNNITNFYNNNHSETSKISLEQELSKYPKELIEFLINPNDEFRKLIATFLENQIVTKNSLSVYSLIEAKKLHQIIGILNYFTSELTSKEIKVENPQDKKDLYEKQKTLKEKYTQIHLYEIIIEELERICKLNGKKIE